MKIALIIPRNSSDNSRSFYDYKFFSTFLLSRKYISYQLAIPTLASLTPSCHELRVFDENIEDIDYDWQADFVGISVRTMFAKRAYEISEMYQKKGCKTVLGGIHPSMCPEEAMNYCDCVVIGEAENILYGGKPVGDFIADILVESSVLCELKAVKILEKSHEQQLLQYPEIVRPACRSSH